MNLALFDFDGTLTSKDSLGEFLKYSVSRDKYIINILKFLPLFTLYKLKLLRNDISKQRLFEIFYAGMDENEFKQIAQDYSLNELDKIILKDRFALLKQHKKNGDRVLIVSASMRSWMEPWCKKHDIELLSTELEFINSKVTGRFSTPNCYNEEKVNRIKKHLHVEEYKKIYAYGDSVGDDAMLALADEATRY
ncbi:MAG TPA: HAD-IB family hydrolase [Sulfurospirillum arcachonense]|nr:HAD-IB family hydrolase [Sulfurospirillum arcachonense]